jgi:hypothetical protein
MAKDKKSFIAYCDWLETFEELTDEEAGKLVKHLLRYVNDQNPITEDKLTKMCFIPIQQSLKRDLKKYEGYVQKQRENGAKGGRPRKPKKPKPFSENPTKPKKADSVSDSVNEFFNNKELDMVFCDFIEHREQIKAKMTPLAITKMINKLLNYETGIAIKMLNKSIENGWKGVFELDEKESSISKNEAEEIDIAIIKNARDVQFNNNNTDVAENNRLRGLS